jgi:hypothetical protein
LQEQNHVRMYGCFGMWFRGWLLRFNSVHSNKNTTFSWTQEPAINFKIPSCFSSWVHFFQICEPFPRCDSHAIHVLDAAFSYNSILQKHDALGVSDETRTQPCLSHGSQVVIGGDTVSVCWCSNGRHFQLESAVCNQVRLLQLQESILWADGADTR